MNYLWSIKDSELHLELMDDVVIDLLNAKWNTFIKFRFDDLVIKKNNNVTIIMKYFLHVCWQVLPLLSSLLFVLFYLLGLLHSTPEPNHTSQTHSHYFQLHAKHTWNEFFLDFPFLPRFAIEHLVYNEYYRSFRFLRRGQHYITTQFYFTC